MRISDWSSDVCSSDLRRAEAVFAHRADAVGQQYPPFVAFDRAAAIAHLNEFPREGRAEQRLSFVVPVGQAVGGEEGDILAILSPDRQIAAADFPRKQRHSLFARGADRKRFEADDREIFLPEQIGRASSREHMWHYG